MLNLLFCTLINPYGTKSHGGAETSCRLLAEKMALRGHRVIYLTGSVDRAARITAFNSGVKLFAAPQLYNKKLGFIRPWSEQRWRLAIGALSLRYRIDLCYCFYELPILQAAISTRKVLRRPKVIMRMAGLHWYVKAKKSGSKRKSYEKAFDQIDSVNYISEGLVGLVEEKMRELKMLSSFDHLFIQDIGASTYIRRDFPYPSLLNTPFRIIMAARFSDYQKRQDILIDAISLLPERLPIKLTLVGNGTRLDQMKKLVCDRNLSNKISFLPFMKQTELMEELQRNHLLCHACDYEGLGKIIVEAMSKGLPALVSDVRPLNNFIVDGENGFLVKNTAEAWASRLEELYLGYDNLLKVSMQSINYASLKWCPDKNILEYENYFDNVISGRT